MDKRKFWALFFLIEFFRFLILFRFDLMPQEAYYFFYSRHLSLSYFDHPPMIAYFLYIFSLIFGDGVVAVRLTSFITTLVSGVLFFYLSKLILGEKRAYSATILFISTIMFSILSYISTPDVVLVLFWIISLIFIYKALKKEKLKDFILSGIFMGFSFSSKYTAVFLPFGLFLFLVLNRKKRHLLFSIKPYLSLIFMFLFSLEVFIWNYKNNWASFLFQSKERVNHFSIKDFFNIFGLIGTQSFLLNIIIYFILLFFTLKFLKKYLKSYRRVLFLFKKRWSFNFLFLLSFFLPIFIAFHLIGILYWVKINWIIPGYITGIILISFIIKSRERLYSYLLSLLFHFILVIEILLYPIPIKSVDTWFGWKSLSDSLNIILKDYNQDSIFLFSDDGYKTTAELLFYLKRKVYGPNILHKFALHYDYIGDDLSKLNGKDAIYVKCDKLDFSQIPKSPPKILYKYFKDVKVLKVILIKDKFGKVKRKFIVYYCKDYHY